MRPQFPTPQINRQQPLNSGGAQGTSQQLPLQQVQQPVQRPVGALSQASMQVPVFFDKSGLTQQQILSQHLQQPQPQLQQPMQQHQLQTPNMLTQAQLGVPPHSQAGHHQMTQPLNVPSNQVGSPMPVQQQPVLPGKCMYGRTYN